MKSKTGSGAAYKTGGNTVRGTPLYGPNVRDVFRPGNGRGPFVGFTHIPLFAVVGDGGYLATSSDLVNWTPLISGIASNFTDIAKNGNNFVASYNGGFVVFNEVSPPIVKTVAGFHFAIANNGPVFIATNNASNVSRSLDNGNTWNILSVASQSTLGIVSNGSRFLVCANSDNYQFTTDDGDGWLSGAGRFNGSTAAVWVCGYNNGRWLGVQNATLTGMLRKDGTDPVPGWPSSPWIQQGLTNNAEDALTSKKIVGNGGDVVLCSFTGLGKIYYSNDNGITWSYNNLPYSAYPNAIRYYNENFYVLIREPGYGSRMLISSDGINFMLKTNFPGIFLNGFV